MYQKKYLGIILLKETKYLSSENCKLLMKDIKDDTKRWKDVPCSWIQKINIIKMTILSKAIYRLNTVCIKLSRAFFTELEQNNLNICMETQKTPNSQSNLEKEKRAGRIRFLTSNYTTRLQSTKQHGAATKTDQWDRTDSPEINSGT